MARRTARFPARSGRGGAGRPGGGARAGAAAGAADPGRGRGDRGRRTRSAMSPSRWRRTSPATASASRWRPAPRSTCCASGCRPGCAWVERLLGIGAGARIGLIDVDAAEQVSGRDDQFDGFVQIRADDVRIEAMRFRRIDRCLLIHRAARVSIAAFDCESYCKGIRVHGCQDVHVGRLGARGASPFAVPDPGFNGLTISDSRRVDLPRVEIEDAAEHAVYIAGGGGRGAQRGHPSRPRDHPPLRPVRRQVQGDAEPERRREHRAARGRRRRLRLAAEPQRGRAPGGERQGRPGRPARRAARGGPGQLLRRGLPRRGGGLRARRRPRRQPRRADGDDRGRPRPPERGHPDPRPERLAPALARLSHHPLPRAGARGAASSRAAGSTAWRATWCASRATRACRPAARSRSRRRRCAARGSPRRPAPPSRSSGSRREARARR